MDGNKLAVAIAGAGIGGLVTGLILARDGHRIDVFERAPDLTDIGAGIQLSPNAMRILDRLGLGTDVRSVAFEPDGLTFWNATKPAALAHLPFKGPMQRQFGAPYLVCHRGDLQHVLLAACRAEAAISLATGVTVSDALDDADCVRIVTQGRITNAGHDVLIAADGLRSALREVVDPSAQVVRDGQTAWRGSVPPSMAARLVPALDLKRVHVFMDDGRHLVAYRMGRRDQINLVWVAESGAAPPPAGTVQWTAAARALVEAADRWVEWPLARVDCAQWVKGRIALLGDAAHAMTPHAAQGGAMAIEDAFALALCLKNHADVPSALARYQRARRQRAARVASLSAANRDIYQAKGAKAVGRDMALRFAPSSLLLKRMDWLYGGE